MGHPRGPAAQGGCGGGRERSTRQGLEISRAASSFKAGNVDVKAGDYVVRGDQPFRTLADVCSFSVRTTRRRIRRPTTTPAGPSS